jgi:hypothetical protein
VSMMGERQYACICEIDERRVVDRVLVHTNMTSVTIPQSLLSTAQHYTK